MLKNTIYNININFILPPNLTKNNLDNSCNLSVTYPLIILFRIALTPENTCVTPSREADSGNTYRISVVSDLPCFRFVRVFLPSFPHFFRSLPGKQRSGSRLYTHTGECVEPAT